MEYVIPNGAEAEKAPPKNAVDRYSNIPREILEDIVTQIKGVHPVERQRLDQFYSENGPDTDSATVERENVMKAMVSFHAPAAVQGTILSIYERNVDYNGYVHIKARIWTAKVRVRIYNLVGGKLEISYSKLLTGNYTVQDTPTTSETCPEEEIALNVLRSALEVLRDDRQFTDAVRGASQQTDPEMSDSGTVKVPIDVSPDGSDIYVDDVWIDKTPCRIDLPLDKKVLIRIEKKPNYETWQSQIIPTRNLRVTRELLPILNHAETSTNNVPKTKGNQ